MLHLREDTESLSVTRLESVVAAALKAGADAAEAVYGETRSVSVGVRDGTLETVESDESCDLGLRVFVGRRSAVVSVSEFSALTLERLVERAVAMARLAPEDPFASLADLQSLHSGKVPDLDLLDDAEPSPEALKARALEIEAAGVGLSPLLRSDGASAGRGLSRWRHVTSHGFSGSQSTSRFFQSGRFIATGPDGRMERDGEGRSARHFADLPDPSLTGRTGATNALEAMNPRRLDTQVAPVLFDRDISGGLIGLFLGAISGAAVARGSSFLKSHLGRPLFAKGITILDDPHRARGLGSCPFDDEGVRVQARNLIDDGVLTTWLLNTASARQLGLQSTGHASRSLAGTPGASAHNVTLLPGTRSRADLMSDLKDGVLITSMFGPSVNSDTGDWSAGASGFRIENGEKTFAVNEITVAGNLIDMFARLIPADDLDVRGALDAPSLLVADLRIGGK